MLRASSGQDGAVDLGFGKNEAILGGIVGFVSRGVDMLKA
jgi:hypothetical protein